MHQASGSVHRFGRRGMHRCGDNTWGQRGRGLWLVGNSPAATTASTTAATTATTTATTAATTASTAGRRSRPRSGHEELG
ncbi:MAG: hypothetical protein ACRDFR_05355, partial [Candidatus Limnocylindria bacterium]